jgi:hypothetical protein
VWWWLWVAVVFTLLLVSTLYNNEWCKHELQNDRNLWLVVSLAWVIVSITAFLGWLEGRGVYTHAGFLMLAVVVHGTALAILVSLFSHQIALFAVVVFMYLLTAQALWTLCPCSGRFPSASIVFLLALAVLLVACLVLPLHAKSERWIAYPYPNRIRWLEPPLPVWQAYLGAFLGTTQMLVVCVVYISLTRQHDESQTIFIVGRMYLVIVYGWKVLWYTLATRGCRGCCSVILRR